MKNGFFLETATAFRRNSKKLIRRGFFSREELDEVVKELSLDPLNPVRSTKLVDSKLGERRWKWGRLRIFYDIDFRKRTIVLLDCKLRDEKTYR